MAVAGQQADFVASWRHYTFNRDTVLYRFGLRYTAKYCE